MSPHLSNIASLSVKGVRQGLSNWRMLFKKRYYGKGLLSGGRAGGVGRLYYLGNN